MKKSLIFSLLLIGLTAISSQIILVREFLTVYYGNELSVGFLLFVWLLGGSLGSIIASIYSKGEYPLKGFMYSQVIISFFIPFSLILARLTRIIFKINIGELISVPIMLLWATVSLLPICAILGFMFVRGCQLYGSFNPAKKITATYLLESIGAIIGGLVTTFLLIRIFNNLEIAFIISFLNLLAAYALFKDSRPLGTVKKKALISFFVIIAIILILGGIRFLDGASLNLKWRGVSLLDSEDSIYGNVALAKISDQYTFFSNGLHVLSMPDNLTAEESVHPAMLMHENPRKILIVGGGFGSLLSEVLKYPIEKITYVELDPLVISMAIEYFKNEPWYNLDNPKVIIKNLDARFFIKNTKERFDVVLINLPDPYTAQINRFYTAQFYSELNRILNKKAIISFGVVSSENYISSDLAKFLRSIYITLKKVFPEVKIIPGDTAYFLASNKINTIILDYNAIEQLRLKKKIDTLFIREYYLFSKLSPERIAYFNKEVIHEDVKKDSFILINRDFHPISYYYDMVLWGTYLSYRFSHFFELLIKIKPWRIFLFILITIMIFAFLFRKNNNYRKAATLFALGTTGFSEITFQILTILSFQIIYGYIYYRLGLILTFFMIGLALGSFYMLTHLETIKQSYKIYIRIQVCVFAYPIILMSALRFISKNLNLQFGSDIIFSILPFTAGVVGGMQFPIANKIYLDGLGDVSRSAGITYASDLIGSCLGAILVSAFIIPLLGVYPTCIGVAGLNLIALIILLFGKDAIKTDE